MVVGAEVVVHVEALEADELVELDPLPQVVGLVVVDHEDRQVRSQGALLDCRMSVDRTQSGGPLVRNPPQDVVFERETGGREPRANPTILPGNRRRGRVRRRPRRSRGALRGIDRPRRALGSGARARREARRPEPAALREADYWRFADWLQPAMDRLWSESRDRLHDRLAHRGLRLDRRTRSRRSRATTATAAATSARGSWRRGCASRRRCARRARPADPALRPALGEPARTRPGWVSNIAQPGQHAAHHRRPEGRARPLLRVARARPAAASGGDGRADRSQRVRAVAYSPFFRYPTSASTRSTSRPSCTPARPA